MHMLAHSEDFPVHVASVCTISHVSVLKFKSSYTVELKVCVAIFSMKVITIQLFVEHSCLKTIHSVVPSLCEESLT